MVGFGLSFKNQAGTGSQNLTVRSSLKYCQSKNCSGNTVENMEDDDQLCNS